jgi:hypothetical protein
MLFCLRWINLIAIILVAELAYAQEFDGWQEPKQSPGDLKPTKCPPGQQPDSKGVCKKKRATRPPLRPPLKPKVEPKVEPKAKPIIIPLEKKTPPPPAKTKPLVYPLPQPKEIKPKVKDKPLVFALPEPKPKKKIASKSKQKEKYRSFIKGELANFIGSSKLISANNRVGVKLGYQEFDQVHYGKVIPEVDLRFGKLELGLGIPLAFEIVNTTVDESTNEIIGFRDAGDIRKEDWDEVGEYARFIRYLTWGRKEDNLYFNLSQNTSATIGHGALMRRYSVNIDPNSTRVSAQFDAYNDYAGFEIITNSIVDWDIFGGIAFIKPLSLFSEDPTARSVSIGFTYIADHHAPVTIETQSDPSDNPYFMVGAGRPNITSHSFLHALGVDLEMKIVKTKNVDLKPYIDYSWLMPSAVDNDSSLEPVGGGGLTIGLLGRFNYGQAPITAIRTVAEFRSFSATYLPGYFDTFYEMQKFLSTQQYSRYAIANDTIPATKFAEIFVNRKDQDRHLGYYLEFGYSIVGYLSFVLSLEGSNAASSTNFMAHMEIPVFEFLQFFASFHQRSMDDIGDLFSSNRYDKQVYSAARVKLLPFLFLNFRYYHTFELKEGFADFNNDGLEQHYRLYMPNNGWMTDVEIGWEF